MINGVDGEPSVGVSGDKSGSSVFSGGDFNGDGFDDLAIGAPRAASDAGDADVWFQLVVLGEVVY